MQPKAKILYVEDDINLGFVTMDNLEIQGYEIIHCTDGASALQAYHQNSIDLCVLDVMLPGMDGFSVAEHIRELNSDVPILFLTAKSQKEDRLYGLRLGADDYIVKPFSIEELVLKIEIFLRRSKVGYAHNHEKEASAQIDIGLYSFDYKNLELHLAGQHISLTQREADLLMFFYTNTGKVMRREQILQAVWGNDDYFTGRSLDVFISRLRKYLKDDPNLLIENIHGVGFRLTQR